MAIFFLAATQTDKVKFNVPQKGSNENKLEQRLNNVLINFAVNFLFKQQGTFFVCK